jgi:hypothetical protein
MIAVSRPSFMTDNPQKKSGIDGAALAKIAEAPAGVP